MHEPDAHPQGLDRSGDGYRLAVQPDNALIRLQVSAQHIHQGGFSRAVFAYQRVDFIPAQAKIHAVQRSDAGKAFGNPAHFQIDIFHIHDSLS